MHISGIYGYKKTSVGKKNLPGPKTVLVTAKVNSFERFFHAGPKTLRVTAKVFSFVDMSTKLPWLEVLPAVKL